MLATSTSSFRHAWLFSIAWGNVAPDRPKSKKMAFSFADLYAGCGGLSLGLMQAGGEGVIAVEKSPDAFKTLWHNLEAPPNLPGFHWPDGIPQQAHEIRTLLADYSSQVEQLAGKIDVVVGGPPCQGFSMYGKRNPHDPRNYLWTAYLQFIERVQPNAVLLENVEGIDMPFVRGREDTGKQCRETAAHRIVRRLKALGFAMKVLRLCASDYGVPQYRPRLFLVGFRADKGDVEKLLTDEFLDKLRKQHLAGLGLTPEHKVTVKQALSDLEIQGKVSTPCPDSKGFSQAAYDGPLTAYQQAMHSGMAPLTAPNSIRLARHKPATVEAFQTIQRLGVRGYKAAARLNAEIGTSKHRRHWLHPGKPAPTITTLPDDFVHYSEPRILTVRECARLQSFPDWFEFQGKYTTGGERRKKECPRFTQVGNAVPPRLAQFIGLYLAEAMADLQSGSQERLAA